MLCRVNTTSGHLTEKSRHTSSGSEDVEEQLEELAAKCSNW
jgi:hypothetical protein